ncbi:uncharacterized protein AB675_11860 [Cyphellophora attinorum]|uniref:Uncharacterized protein n=1 Tax=Cyphellophora attinorum TaxID=1664694 RepID=A0A0N1H4A4_9EURO|nr:uncharacterized protein AB675_11860 [Phialophora attinorum]KPI36795.1 hypothetical protein AB675_11860 [Phialophora attinorum]
MATSAIAGTTSRLRKTFKAAIDGDDSDIPSDMDEQEQDELIEKISSSNDSANLLYTRIFTVLPLVGVLPFLWTLLSGRSFLPCLLGISSLLLSSLTMGFIPLDTSANLGSNSEPTLSSLAHARASRRNASAAGRGALLGLDLPFELISVDEGSPVRRYALVLDGVLSAIMAVGGFMLMGRDSKEVGDGGFWLLCLLPGVMCVVVVVVRGAMRDAERGLGGLRALGERGGFKGA